MLKLGFSKAQKTQLGEFNKAIRTQIFMTKTHINRIIQRTKKGTLNLLRSNHQEANNFEKHGLTHIWVVQKNYPFPYIHTTESFTPLPPIQMTFSYTFTLPSYSPTLLYCLLTLLPTPTLDTPYFPPLVVQILCSPQDKDVLTTKTNLLIFEWNPSIETASGLCQMYA